MSLYVPASVQKAAARALEEEAAILRLPGSLILRIPNLPSYHL